jgi:hypothetical protein
MGTYRVATATRTVSGATVKRGWVVERVFGKARTCVMSVIFKTAEEAEAEMARLILLEKATDNLEA